MANIWAFKYVLKNDEKVANKSTATPKSNIPILVPATSKNDNSLVNNTNSKITTIDVVKDFFWTNSPVSSREEVPYVILTEKRLKTNALVSQLLYSFGAATAGLGDVTTYIKETLGPNSFTKSLQWVQSESANLSQEATQNISRDGVVGKLVNDITSLKDENQVMDSKLLKAYKNLYLTQDTGWRYILPYFNNYNNDVSNTFGGDTTMPTLGILRATTEGVAAFQEAVAALANPATFSFAERAKFYSYPEQGDEISVEFPLINTGAATYEDVKANWQFLFLLLYQNKPGRITKNVIEPPVLYQIEIPGQKFMPFGYISSITVDFKGSRRTLEIDIPVQEQYFSENPLLNKTNLMNSNRVIDPKNFSTTKKITTIIPDAYMVKINLKGLVADSRNFMAAALESNSNGDFATNIIERDKLFEQNSVLTSESFNSIADENISIRPGE